MKGDVLEFLKERNIPYQRDWYDPSIWHIRLRFGNSIHLEFTEFAYIEHMKVGYSVKGPPTTAFFNLWCGAVTAGDRVGTTKPIQEACNCIEDWVKKTNSLWPPVLSNAVALLHCLKTKGIIRDVRILLVQTYIDEACKSARAELRNACKSFIKI
jgi:hypothetical protein